MWTKWFKQIKLPQLKTSKSTVKGLEKELFKKYVVTRKMVVEFTKKTCNDAYKHAYGYKITQGEEETNNRIKQTSLKFDKFTKDLKYKIKNIKLEGYTNLYRAILIRDLYHGEFGKIVLKALAMKIIHMHSPNIEDIRKILNLKLQKHNIIKEEITAEQFREYITIIFLICKLPVKIEFKDSENITSNDEVADNTKSVLKDEEKVTSNENVNYTDYNLETHSSNDDDCKDLNKISDKSVEEQLKYSASAGSDFKYTYSITPVLDNKASDIIKNIENSDQPNEYEFKAPNKNPEKINNFEYPYNITSTTDKAQDIIANRDQDESNEHEHKKINKDTKTSNNFLNINTQYYSMFFGVRFASRILQYCVKFILKYPILNKNKETSLDTEKKIWGLKKILLITRMLIIISILFTYITY